MTKKEFTIIHLYVEYKDGLKDFFYFFEVNGGYEEVDGHLRINERGIIKYIPMINIRKYWEIRKNKMIEVGD